MTTWITCYACEDNGGPCAECHGVGSTIGVLGPEEPVRLRPVLIDVDLLLVHFTVRVDVTNLVLLAGVTWSILRGSA